MRSSTPRPRQTGQAPSGELNENIRRERRSPSGECPRRAKSNLRSSWISVSVPTVDRGPGDEVLWLTATAGERPLMGPTLGRRSLPMNWRA